MAAPALEVLPEREERNRPVAAMQVGLGLVAGNLALAVLVVVSPTVDGMDLLHSLLFTSGVMLTVGLLACIVPARRALRIQPTEALKEA